MPMPHKLLLCADVAHREGLITRQGEMESDLVCGYPDPIPWLHLTKKLLLVTL